MLNPLAYSFEASWNCPACTRARFGEDENGYPPESARDGEGNPIGAVAPWDEWHEPSEIRVQVLACDTCGRELDRWEPLDAITAETERQGEVDGRAAGSWLIDGNSTQETAWRLLQGIEDGDPEVLDSVPSAPLSGEWADGLLSRDLLAEYGLNEDDDAADDVLTAYESGFARGVADEVERAALAMLPEGSDDER
jgi:hypothetical protein